MISGCDAFRQFFMLLCADNHNKAPKEKAARTPFCRFFFAPLVCFFLLFAFSFFPLLRCPLSRSWFFCWSVQGRAHLAKQRKKRSRLTRGKMPAPKAAFWSERQAACGATEREDTNRQKMASKKQQKLQTKAATTTKKKIFNQQNGEESGKGERQQQRVASDDACGGVRLFVWLRFFFCFCDPVRWWIRGYFFFSLTQRVDHQKREARRSRH